jgi:hypothetical protein
MTDVEIEGGWGSVGARRRNRGGSNTRIVE